MARVHADATVHLLMVHERGLGWDYRSRGGAWPDAPTLYLLSDESGFLDPSIFLRRSCFQKGLTTAAGLSLLRKSRFSIAYNWQTQGLFQRQSDSPLNALMGLQHFRILNWRLKF